ncbi:MAG: T9SS type A sorting domain-containing protein [Ignavibacteria bacterium]|nr:T9SS type A sorting domain-containing protein [Ignavibacteria bacterium]
MLKQNYPNPFNPVTNIEFSVSKSTFVKLAVFDVTGRELETLVSQNMSPGTYKADWDASKYSSGVYFYTITSGSYHHTKKMILIK